MTDKKKLESAYNAAKEKFTLYLQSVYGLLKNKNEQTIIRREEARRDWQKAFKKYNDLKFVSARQNPAKQ